MSYSGTSAEPDVPQMIEIAEKNSMHKAAIVGNAQHFKLTSAHWPIFHRNVEKYTTIVGRNESNSASAGAEVL